MFISTKTQIPVTDGASKGGRRNDTIVFKLGNFLSRGWAGPGSRKFPVQFKACTGTTRTLFRGCQQYILK